MARPTNLEIPRPNRLKALRVAAGITAYQLAQKIGCREVSVYTLENRARPPRAEVAAQIAEFLGVTVDQIWETK